MEEFNPKEIARDIAKRVTALRLQKAWTREVLAEQSGVNVYTLKHFERSGQISLHRLIAISHALEMSTELERLFKPRHRVDMNNWSLEPQTTRKRGRRRRPEDQINGTMTQDAAQQTKSQSIANEPSQPRTRAPLTHRAQPVSSQASSGAPGAAPIQPRPATMHTSELAPLSSIQTISSASLLEKPALEDALVD